MQIARILGVCAMLVACPASAGAVSYSGLYVFGDSLVDSGNVYVTTGGALASGADGYYGGRFSNGFNFADYLSIHFAGTPATAALLGGSNFAVGGANAAYAPGEVSPSFLAQVAAFASGGTPITSDALVLVTFGGNDVRDTIGTGGTIDFTAAATDLALGLNQLYALGARNFVVTGAPDIGQLPVSIGTAGAIPGRLAELTDRSQQISTVLSTQTTMLDSMQGANAQFFDLFAYQQALLADPSSFGLPAGLNTTTPCQIVGGGEPQIANCDNALYFDVIHPTTQVHAAIATAIIGQLNASAVPEAESWALLIMGFAGTGVVLRRQRFRAAAPT